uniref:Uncharacterized protein n=1 Tax=Pseudomonas fluorescens (strain SBW25) TaxID=216595 RepID=A0A0G4E5C1_PSEFS|nr:hypothetical protein PQBR57_0426 [Pseudomonas fluorescens SBW25]
MDDIDRNLLSGRSTVARRCNPIDRNYLSAPDLEASRAPEIAERRRGRYRPEITER